MVYPLLLEKQNRKIKLKKIVNILVNALDTYLVVFLLCGIASISGVTVFN